MAGQCPLFLGAGIKEKHTIMSVRLGRFELPKVPVADETTKSATYAKFTAEPFEQGYGVTVGNALRRVLLSSIEGGAITTVKITGANH